MEVLILRTKKLSPLEVARGKHLKHPRGAIVGVYPDYKIREPLRGRFCAVAVRELEYDRHTYLEDRRGRGRKSRPFIFKFWRLPRRLRKALRRKGRARISEELFFRLTRERLWP